MSGWGLKTSAAGRPDAAHSVWSDRIYWLDVPTVSQFCISGALYMEFCK